MQQQKGRRAELELVELLQAAGFQDVRPGQSVSFGGEPDICGLPGIHIEVKRHERLALYEWLRQAARDAEFFGDGVPAVFHRTNRMPWLVTVGLDDFLKLIS